MHHCIEFKRIVPPQQRLRCLRHCFNLPFKSEVSVVVAEDRDLEPMENARVTNNSQLSLAAINFYTHGCSAVLFC